MARIGLQLALKQANPVGFFGPIARAAGDRPGMRGSSCFRSVIKDCFLGKAPRQTGRSKLRRQLGAPRVGRTMPQRAGWPATQRASEVVWFSPGKLLVIGDTKLQASTLGLLRQLADAKAKLPAELAALHKLTVKRAASRQADDDKQAAARRRHNVAIKHAHFGWQLLASAVAGKLDLEAFSELEIAWSQPETSELLVESAKPLILRSLWTLTEAGRAMPDEPRLRALIEKARALCEPKIIEAEAALQKSPTDAAAFITVLYGALANRDRPADAARRRELLLSQPGQSPERSNALCWLMPCWQIRLT